MRILTSGGVLAFAIFLLSCDTYQDDSTQTSAKVLYETFENAQKLALRSLRESNLDGCGYLRGFDDPSVKHEWITLDFVDDIRSAKKSLTPLATSCVALLDFSMRIDSLIEDIAPTNNEQFLIQAALPNVVRSIGPFTPRDTAVILSEVTRVLLLATSTLIRGRWSCGFGDDLPYVLLSPIPKSDSFSVRVGLRMPRLCVDSTNYVVVFGDTIPYTSNAWADVNFHRNMLLGVDTLWVKSCMGNGLTGAHWCVDTWEVVGW